MAETLVKRLRIGGCRCSSARDTGSRPAVAASYQHKRDLSNIPKKGMSGPFLTDLLQRCANQEQLKQGTLWGGGAHAAISVHASVCPPTLAEYVLTCSFQDSGVKRNFGVVMDSSRFLLDSGRNQINFFVLSLSNVMESFFKSDIKEQQKTAKIK